MTWEPKSTRRPDEERPIIPPLELFSKGSVYNLIDSSSPDKCFQNTQGPLSLAVDGSGIPTRQTAILCQYPAGVRQGDIGFHPITDPLYDPKARFFNMMFWQLRNSAAQPQNQFISLAGGSGTFLVKVVQLRGTSDTPPKPPYDPTTVTWNSIIAAINASGDFTEFNASAAQSWKGGAAQSIPGYSMRSSTYGPFREFGSTTYFDGGYAAAIILSNGALNSQSVQCDGVDLWFLR